jgi:hypothetical protein
MTEAEWFTCTNSGMMIEAVRGKVRCDCWAVDLLPGKDQPTA